MATIEERIVNMKFNNSGFASGVQSTMSLLDRLKGALRLGGASRGIEDVNASMGRFNINPMMSGLQVAQTGFSSLQTIAVGSLLTIGNKITDLGLQMAGGLSMKPVMDGFREYETKIGSIQTIYANTHEKYGTSYDDITKSLNELNHYADKTIYSFGDMTRNIGLFTNAGLELNESTSMIKGFSNAAAASGTDSQRAAGAAYQLSQGLSQGKITLMDWNSLVNAGMGNAVMKEGLVDIAHAMGTLDSSTMNTSESIEKNFRDSLQDGWITSDVMSNYLQIMSGDMDDAKMASMGLTQEQIDGFKRQQAVAEEAATKVRTFTQLMETMTEAVGSSWGQTFEILFGEFEEATELFTPISNTLGEIIGKSADARNNLLKGWKDLGGRMTIIDGFKNVFNNLVNIGRQVGEAFREIFPPMTAEKLFAITKGFQNLTEKLMLNDGPLETIYYLSKSLFAILDIGISIVSAVVRQVIKVTSAILSMGDGYSSVAPKVFDVIDAFRQWIKSGQGLTGFIDKIGDAVVGLAKGAGGFASGAGQALGKVFEKIAGIRLDGVTERLSQFWRGLEKLGDVAGSAAKKLFGSFDGLGDFFVTIGGALGKGIEHIIDYIGQLAEALTSALSGKDFSGLFDGINTAIFAGLALTFKRFLGGGSLVEQIKEAITGGGDDAKGSLLSRIKEMLVGDDEDNLSILGKAKEAVTGAFEPLTETLSAMQSTLKASTLLQIGIAVGVLAGSVALLAGIDSGKLTKALLALTVMFTQLAGMLYVIQAMNLGKVGTTLPLLGAGLILLAGAITLLVIPVTMLSQLSWEELVKGLGAVAILLLEVSFAAKIISANSGGLISAGLGLIALSIAINLLAIAVGKLGKLDLPTLAKGLGAVAVLLVSLALFSKFNKAGVGTVAAGLGLIALATGLIILSKAVDIFGRMDLATLGQGLIGVGAALAILVLAVNAMPATLPLTAAGILILSGAMVVLGQALILISTMNAADSFQSLITLGGALAILAIGVNAMTGAVAGAAAMLLVVGALALFTPILITLGTLPWEVILTGLAALALSFGVLAAAGYLLTPVVPTLIGLSIAIGLLGASVLLILGGLALFVGALALLATGIASLATVGSQALTDLFNLFPVFFEALGKGIITLLETLTASGKAIVDFVVTIISSVLTAIQETLPQIMDTVRLILESLLSLIVDMTPKIVDAFILIMTSIFDAIVVLTPNAVDAVITLCEEILRAIRVLTPQIVQTGVEMVMALVNGIVALIPQLVDAGMRLIIGILDGIARNIGQVITKGTDVIVNFLQGIQQNIGRVADEGAKTIIAFINGLSVAIRNNAGALRQAAARLGWEIINGLTGGLAEKVGNALSKAREVGGAVLATMQRAMGINSPSKYTIEYGKFLMEGLAIGQDKNARIAVKSAREAGNDTVDALKDAMYSGINDLALTPSITPILNLDEVSSGFRSINDMTIGASSSSLAGHIYKSRSFDDRSVVGGANSTVVNFTQNNTSPKDLQPIELYRLTKNLTSQIKKEVFN